MTASLRCRRYRAAGPLSPATPGVGALRFRRASVAGLPSPAGPHITAIRVRSAAAAGPLSPAAAGGAGLRPRRGFTTGFHGLGRVRGVLDRQHYPSDAPPVQAVAVSRPVLLLTVPGLQRVRFGWSSAAGEIEFDWIDPALTVLAYSPGFRAPDGSWLFAECQDAIRPEQMA
jgi:hypothetical protein